MELFVRACRSTRLGVRWRRALFGTHPDWLLLLLFKLLLMSLAAGEGTSGARFAASVPRSRQAGLTRDRLVSHDLPTRRAPRFASGSAIRRCLPHGSERTLELACFLRLVDCVRTHRHAITIHTNIASGVDRDLVPSRFYICAYVQDEIGGVGGVADHCTFAPSRLKLQMVIMVKPCQASERHELLWVFMPMERFERRHSAVRLYCTRTNVLEEFSSIAPEPIW